MRIYLVYAIKLNIATGLFKHTQFILFLLRLDKRVLIKLPYSINKWAFCFCCCFKSVSSAIFYSCYYYFLLSIYLLWKILEIWYKTAETNKGTNKNTTATNASREQQTLFILHTDDMQRFVRTWQVQYKRQICVQKKVYMLQIISSLWRCMQMVNWELCIIQAKWPIV